MLSGETKQSLKDLIRLSTPTIEGFRFKDRTVHIMNRLLITPRDQHFYPNRTTISYTEDKVVLNFHGNFFFCLTQGGVRQANTPCYPPKVIVASRFFSVIYNSACDPLLILFVYVIKIKYALQNVTVTKV